MKSHKRTHRGVKYDALAEGYKILKSPLADSFSAAAEHYEKADAPNDEGETKPKSTAGNSRA
jgi:hypothetical protein